MKLLALIKKELYRFFHDPRLIVTMLLPGIVIFLLYTMLGEIIYNAEPETYRFRVYRSGESQLTALFESAAEGAGHTLEWLPLEDEAAAREAVKAGEATAILYFSDGFDASFDAASPVRGEVKIVYNALDDAGGIFYGMATSLLQRFGMRFEVVSESLATQTDIGKQVMQNILPFLMVALLFSACMSVTLESVAGEKERGTLATVLVTSVRRRDIALGKVIPLSLVSLLGALSSFFGVILSMPKLMGLGTGFFAGYSAWSYVLMLPLVLSVVPFIVALISAVSAFSRSVKEASGYTGMLMILVMVVSLVSTFLPGIGDWAVALPVLNSVVMMQRILSGGLPVWQSLVSTAVNLAFCALLVAVIAKMLSSERLMFGK